MTRSLRVALLGWSVGFLVAGLWGLSQPGNHRLASALFVPAGVGMVALGVFLVIGALRQRRWTDLDDVDGPDLIPTHGAHAWSSHTTGADVGDATTAAASAQAAATRIAELEARLALEQQQLDNVRHVLAAADALAGSGADTSAQPTEVDLAAAAEIEPLLRQEVLDTLVELVGRKDVFREFEALTAPRRPPLHPPAVERLPVSEEYEVQPARQRRRRVENKGALDKRAERVGQRDLRGGRARHTQQVGRADEDG